MIDKMMESLVEWFLSLIGEFLRFGIEIMNTTSTSLLTDETFLYLTGILTSISLVFASLGTVVAFYDYFNTLDNSNSAMQNTNITDYLVPIIYSFTYSSTFVSGAIALFKMFNGFIASLTVMINAEEINLTAVDYAMMKSPGARIILNLIIFGLSLYFMFKLFKAMIVKVPVLLVLLFDSTYKSFAIARGDYTGISNLIYQSIGLNLILCVQTLLFCWGFGKILSFDFNATIVGLGLIMTSGKMDELLSSFVYGRTAGGGSGVLGRAASSGMMLKQLFSKGA